MKAILKKAGSYVIKEMAEELIKETIKKKDDDVVGIGISWLWMLPTTHKFYICAVRHDAHYDAIEIYQGKKSLNDLPKEPIGYRGHVENALYEFNCQHLSINRFIENADQVFREQCLRIAKVNNSVWLRIQAELYYQIVRKWSSLKFKDLEK